MQKFDACEWFGRRKRRGESSWWVRRHLPEASPRTPPGVRGEVGCVACSTHLPESGVRLAVSATLSKRTLRRAYFYEAPADLFRPKRERIYLLRRLPCPRIRGVVGGVSRWLQEARPRQLASPGIGTTRKIRSNPKRTRRMTTTSRRTDSTGTARDRRTT